MRRIAALAVLAGLAGVLAACDVSDPSAESVVRAWSQAVNTEDNAAAARQFGVNARVVQGDETRVLRTFDEALAWNRSLPCSGRIVSVRTQGEIVRVTFVLAHRIHSRCDGPGARAATLFRVENGKIVLWHQLEPGLQPDDESV